MGKVKVISTTRPTILEPERLIWPISELCNLKIPPRINYLQKCVLISKLVTGFSYKTNCNGKHRKSDDF